MRSFVALGAGLPPTTVRARGREVVGGGPSAAMTKEGGPSVATTRGSIRSAAMTRGGSLEATMTGRYGPLSAMMSAGSRSAFITGRRCPSPSARTPHQA